MDYGILNLLGFIIAAIGAVGAIIARDRTIMMMMHNTKEECFKLFVLKEDYHRGQNDMKERLTKLEEKTDTVYTQCSKIIAILETKKHDGTKI